MNTKTAQWHMIMLSDIRDDLLVTSAMSVYVSNPIEGKWNPVVIFSWVVVLLVTSCLCLSNIFLDQSWRWLVGRAVLRCWSESKPKCSGAVETSRAEADQSTKCPPCYL